MECIKQISQIIVTDFELLKYVVIVTIYGLYKSQFSTGVSVVILPDVDLQCVIRASAVVVEELQTLVSSFGVKEPALQLSRISSVGYASAEVHEIPRA